MRNLVILGGGYGGLSAAVKLLGGYIPDDVMIILIDRMPYQGLKTEYYALASGSVSEMDIRTSFPLDPRLTLYFSEVNRIDLANKLVELNGEDWISYDWLIISLGCVDLFRDIPGAREYAHSIQSLSSARQTYQKIFEVKPYGQVTIVGGGLSGVEVASELRENRPDLRIRILDRGPSILSAFPESLQEYVRQWFLKHDVEMRSHISLSRIEEGLLHNRQEPIRTDITIWTAGIQPSPVIQQLDLQKDAMGRVVINKYHQVPTYPEVFVVGDCASLPYAPSAQAAGSQGKQVAEVLQAFWKNETPKLPALKVKGVLGSLGKSAGFGMLGGRPVCGRVPRLLKSGVLWKSKHHIG